MSATRLVDERTLMGAVSVENLTRHNAAIAKGVRLSGSAAEAEAFAYLAEQCRGYGMDVRQYAVEAYVSLPGVASLAVVEPEARDVECITHSFGLPTGPDGLTGALVYVGAGEAADYTQVDARGKIALVEGLAGPPKAFAAARAGARGIVCINAAGLHEMIISPVWGTPTTDTAPFLPQVVAVSIRKEAGEALKRLCAAGETTVRITAEVTTRWTRIPTLTADLPGAEDRFVLLSGHVDSWHYGAMDNASANATMLEVARICGEQQGALRRGLRLAFWSGHSHARYGASAWYADEFFADLYDHCVCHVNAESTGAMGADDLSHPGNMAETWRFATGPVRDVAGQELTYRRMTRNSDQSFTGIGVPSAFSGLASQSDGGLGAWWHTPDDTLDKIDPANFVRDTQVYLLACWRLCTLPVLPFDYADTADEVLARLRQLDALVAERFDLAPALAEAAAFKAAASRLNAAITDAGTTNDAARAETLNRALMAVGRALIPINYTATGPYGVDLALDAPPLPGLAPLADLAALDPGMDAARFLATRLMRERNRVQHALVTARRAIEAEITDGN